MSPPHSAEEFFKETAELEANSAQRFRRALAQGQRASLDDFLPSDGSPSLALLVELIRIELEHRLQTWESVRVESYLEKYPLLTADPSAAISLIAAEFDLRRVREPGLTRQEYARRFPKLRRELEEHWHSVEASTVARPALLRQAEELPSAAADPGNASTVTEAQSRAPAIPRIAGALPEIPGCEMLGLLGRGGMGVVYKARQRQLNRLVAIKMILAGAHAGTEHRDRFLAEARAVAQLRHPNIVQIHEIGEHDGRPYFFLEFADGGSLASRLDGTPRPPRQSAYLVRALAQAMHVAHQQGIVHRDLKPANVLMAAVPGAPEGQPDAAPNGLDRERWLPKIADFGLAKQLDQDAGQTQSGAIMGTPSYMAPEQAEGKGKEVGPAADVYALGAILYELLTGRPPFRGTTVLETLEQVRTQEAVPPTRLQPKVPRDLETICLKCLQKDPKNRYVSAAKLADDLRRFLDDEPIEARPVSEWGLLWHWMRRNRAVAWASALAAAFLGVGVGVAVILALQQSAVASKLAQENARAEQALLDLREASRQQQKYTRLASQLCADRGEALWQQQEGRQGLLWLARGLEISSEQDAELRTRLHARLRTCPANCQFLSLVLPQQGEVRQVSFSSDGKQILTRTAAGRIRRWEPASGDEVGEALALEPEETLTMAPGSKWAVRTDASQALLLDAATGKLIGEPIKFKAPAAAVAFSGDGRILATGGGTPPGATSKLLAVMIGGTELWLFDAATGLPMGRPWTHPPDVLTLTFSPDCKFLASTTGTWREDAPAPRQVHLWNVATGQRIGEPLNFNGRRLSLAFSPDSKTFAAVSGRTVEFYNTASARLLGRRLEHPLDVAALAFSPDGKWLLTGTKPVAGPRIDTGQVQFWDVATGKPVGQPVAGLASPAVASIIRVAFSPDGQLFLIQRELLIVKDGQSWTNEVQLWDASTRNPLGNPRKLIDPLSPVSFDAGGKTLSITDPNGTSYRIDAMGKTVGDRITAGWAMARDPQEGGFRATFLNSRPQPSPPYQMSTDGKEVFWIPECSPEKGVAALSPAQVFFRGETSLWDTATGRQIGQSLAHKYKILSLALSSDGKTLATAGEDSTVQLWNVPKGTPIGPPLVHNSRIQAITFSPKGARLLTLTFSGDVGCWNTSTGERVPLPLGDLGPVKRMAVCLTRDVVALVSKNQVRLFALRSGQFFGKPLVHRGPINDLAFSADGQFLLTGSDDKTARVLDTSTGEPVGPPLEHDGKVLSVVFAPDGQSCATGGVGGARLWKRNGSPTTQLDQEASVDRWIVWTQVVTGLELDNDGQVHVLDPEDWRQHRQRLQELGGPPLR